MNTQWNTLLRKTVLGPLTVIVAAGSLGNASAETNEPRYTLNAISDTAQGEKILAGNYQEAIEKIDPDPRRARDRFFSATNLCVAHILSRDLDGAAPYCDSAIAEYENAISVRPNGLALSIGKRAQQRYLSIALSNRGVLHAMRGEEDRARADFEKAIGLRPSVPAPEVNLARLERDDDTSA